MGGVWGDARITIVLSLDKYVEAGCCGMGASIIGHGALLEAMARAWYPAGGHALEILYYITV